jgi:peptidoglycan/LPS O-acetylase OafA/YrhL
MSAIAVEQVSAKNATKRFYRPELDLLRLLAFALVFLAHGPRLGHSSVSWRQALFAAYNNGADSGIYGLCLFFFLSSYLITELLLREQETTGTVHLASFYRRRILRIWPLYYLAVGLSALCPLLLPDSRFNWHQILYLLLFVGYLGKDVSGQSVWGVLWSISVEELFYALWPWLVRWGRTTLIWVSLGLIVLSPFIGTSQRQADFWYNPLAHFLFFAGGALTALWLHGRSWQRSRSLAHRRRGNWLACHVGHSLLLSVAILRSESPVLSVCSRLLFVIVPSYF